MSDPTDWQWDDEAQIKGQMVQLGDGRSMYTPPLPPGHLSLEARQTVMNYIVYMIRDQRRILGLEVAPYERISETASKELAETHDMSTQDAEGVQPAPSSSSAPVSSAPGNITTKPDGTATIKSALTEENPAKETTSVPATPTGVLPGMPTSDVSPPNRRKLMVEEESPSERLVKRNAE
jgi:hypothetical protein